MAKVCRLCLKKDSFIISIFGDYGTGKDLCNLIKKNVQLRIDQNDSVTKYICYACVTKLEFVEKFREEIHDNQKKLVCNMESDDMLFEENSLDSLITSPTEPPKKRKISEHFNDPMKLKKMDCNMDGLFKSNTPAKTPEFPEMHNKNKIDFSKMSFGDFLKNDSKDLLDDYWEYKFKHLEE